MPVEIRPDVDNHLIRLSLSGLVTLEEVRAMIATLVGLLDGAAHAPVHILCELSQMKIVPQQVTELHRLLKPSMHHPRCGWSVIYGLSSLTGSFIINTLMSLFQARTRLVATEQEALHFLAGQDAVLRAALAARQQIQQETGNAL
ncbi:MAG: hypothetical protein MUE40_14670 [Anaerolineae bacterium]|nr:hypothetical protein [Anaerolineae bacterium]